MHTSRHIVVWMHVLGWTSAAFLSSCVLTGPSAAQEHPADVAQLDGFVRQVFVEHDTARFEAAAEAYLAMLERAPASHDARDHLLPHLKYALDVMPPAERPAETGERADEEALLAAGPAVARWWRRQDPFPGTRANERLEEHLDRFVTAANVFSQEGELDDRGRIYLRLGPPTDRLVIALPAAVRAFDFESSIPVPRLADNELWVYDHISDDAHFFFLRHSRRGPYRLAVPNELIPSQLRSGFGARSDRGREKAEMLLHVAEEIYAQLALAHPFYGPTFDDIAHFRGRPLSRSDRVPDAVRSILADATAREIEFAGRRGRVADGTFSNTRGLTETLPVQARWARFLGSGDSTRTEIYWRVDADDLMPSRRLRRAFERAGTEPSETYVLVVSAARHDVDYRMEEVHRQFFRLNGGSAAQQMALQTDTSTFHFSAQWDLYWAEPSQSGLLPYGPALKSGTVQIDSITALEATRFEMSDLKLTTNGSPVAGERFEAMPDLYFELYNLHYGPDDLTRYTIEYVVRAEGTDAAPTTQSRTTQSRTTQSGRERHTVEQIALQLADLSRPARIHVHVHVTDEVTGEVRARAVSFEASRP